LNAAPASVRPPGEFGKGKKFSSACPLLLIRFAGMRFPSKGLPVTGSVMTTGFPVLSTDFEKSPRRSRSVGIVTNTGSVGVIVCGFSREKKKKALSLLSFGKSFGIRTGPLKLNPQML